jgi:hypothetical protein
MPMPRAVPAVLVETVGRTYIVAIMPNFRKIENLNFYQLAIMTFDYHYTKPRSLVPF